MGPVLWTLYFIQAQGYTVESKHNVLRHQQHHASDAKREEIKLEEYQTHQRKIFIFEGCYQQRRNVGGIFPH